MLYGFKKKEMYESAEGRFEVTEKQVSDLFASMSGVYLGGLDKYSGALIQINTRIPEGLDDRIEILVKPEYGLKNKTEYIRASIVCLLSQIGQVDEVFDDAEKMIKQQKRITEMINKTVLEGLNSGKTAKEIVDMAFKKLEELEP